MQLDSLLSSFQATGCYQVFHCYNTVISFSPTPGTPGCTIFFSAKIVLLKKRKKERNYYGKEKDGKVKQDKFRGK